MTDKQTYWLADADGARAVVTGKAERDRWIPLGWSDADEPGPDDWVWLRHDETGGQARFAGAAVPLWEPRGWRPSSPPEPVDMTRDPQLVDPPAAAPEPAPQTKTSQTKAASGETKE